MAAELDLVANTVVAYYAGEHLIRPITEAASLRVRHVIDVAKSKLGDRMPTLAERMVWKVAEEAAITDSPIVADYLGGVLASSTEEDDGAAIVAQIGRLSSLDLRIHWVVYRELGLQLREPDTPVVDDINSDFEIAEPYRLYIPLGELLAALGLAEGSRDIVRLQSSLRTLASEGLIASTAYRSGRAYVIEREGFLVGSKHHLDPYLGDDYDAPGSGLVVRPSAQGMTLFCWGIGAEEPSPATFRGIEGLAKAQPGADVAGCPGAKLVGRLRRK